MRKLVFSNNDLPLAARDRTVLGGKGLSLVEMSDLGLPVPPWFTVSTSACRASMQEGGRWPRRLAWQLRAAIGKLECQMQRQLGNPKAPLLVSVRSGAPASMPGMMDTILNLGLTPKIVSALGKEHANFAADLYKRFLEMFGQTALDVSYDRVHKNNPDETDAEFWIDKYREVIKRKTGRHIDDPVEQLALAVVAVQRSWTSGRAAAYRASQDIPGWWGTAVTVQSMVFGNAPGFSGTGVVFSADTTTGARGITGDWLEQAQGEDVVCGKHNALPVQTLQELRPDLYVELLHHVHTLEQHYDDVVDVEFTIESAKLWILQARKAKRTAAAAATYLVRRVFAREISKPAAAEALSAEQVMALRTPSVDAGALRGLELDGVLTVLATGTPVSGGAVHGVIATTSAMAKKLRGGGKSPILVRPDTSPEDLPGMLASVGIVTAVGGATSHAAVVARGIDVACVVGAPGLSFMVDGTLRILGTGDYKEGTAVTLDAKSGRLYLGHLPLADSATSWEVKQFLHWLDVHAEVCGWPKPKLAIQWDAGKNACTLLFDFYLTEAMFKDTRVAGPAAFRKEVARFRQAYCVELSEFMAGYLLVAVSGEMRHARSRCSGMGAGVTSTRYTKEMTALGMDLKQSYDRNTAQTLLCDTLIKQQQPQHLAFFDLCVVTFGLPDWGGSYGGKKWKVIAEAPPAFLKGELPPPVFIDHAFDLQHNGGSVFDKSSKMIVPGPDLPRRLNIKKAATSTLALYNQLRAPRNYRCEETPPSAPVEALWQKGLKLGLWK